MTSTDAVSQNATPSNDGHTNATHLSRSGQIWGAFAALVLLGLITINVAVLIRQLDLQRRESREHAFWTLYQPGAGTADRTECFLSLVREGNTRWEGALLERLDLAHADLHQASLSKAAFTDGQMPSINFREANLRGVSLTTCDLTEADFQDAAMRNATLFKSTLVKANFRNADLLSASLEQANAGQANFVTAKMADAFLAMADLTGTDLTAADLTGADLSAAILTNGELALTNLADADLTDTDFTNTNWWRARGLTTSQLNRLAEEFPPDSSATESRQRDFRIWSETWTGKTTGPE